MANPEEIDADMLAIWNGKGSDTRVARQERPGIALTPVTDTLLALTLLGCVLLCACTQNSQWEDTTGQGRTDEQRKADYGTCYEKAGFKPDGTHPPLNEGFLAITKCMSEHGWRVAAEPIKKWTDTTGQGRTDEQWKADYGACYEKAGFKPDETNLPLNKGFPAFTKCMSERGWKVVVEPIKR